MTVWFTTWVLFGKKVFKHGPGDQSPHGRRGPKRFEAEDREGMRAFLADNGGPAIKRGTAQWEASRFYLTEGFKDLNGRLRSGTTLEGASVMGPTRPGPKSIYNQTLTEVRDHLDGLCQSGTFPEPTVVLRGISKSGIDRLAQAAGGGVEKLKGRTFHSRAFTSTTLDPMTADKFANYSFYNREKRPGAICEIVAPKGQKGWMVKRDKDDNNEYEIVLPRETRFRVVDVKKGQAAWSDFDRRFHPEAEAGRDDIRLILEIIEPGPQKKEKDKSAPQPEGEEENRFEFQDGDFIFDDEEGEDEHE